MADDAALRQLLASKQLDAVREVDALWPDLRAGADPNAVYRQRTALNRLRTFAALAGALAVPPPPKRAAKDLRDWRRILGAVRDLDVVEEWIGKAAQTGGDGVRRGGDLFAGIARAERSAAAARLADAIDAREGRDARRALESVEHQLRRRIAGPAPGVAIDADGPATDHLVRRLCAPFLADWAKAHDRAAATMAAEPLHDLRRVNKRLRDAARFAEEAAGGPGDARLAQRLQALHNALGALNDLDVLQAWCRAAAGRAARDGAWTPKQAADATRLLRRVAREEAARFGKLLDAWPDAGALAEDLRGG